MKLKIYSDRDYIPEGMPSVAMLAPFWRTLKEHKYSWSSRFDSYIENGSSWFEMTSLKEADVAILPVPWREIRGTGRKFQAKENKEAKRLAIEFYQQATKAEKPVVVFFLGPRSDEPIPLKEAIVFRGSLYRSQRQANEFTSPLWTEDIVKYYFENILPIRQKKEKPVVGFCGFVQKEQPLMQLKDKLHRGIMFAKTGQIKGSPYLGHSLRAKAVKYLSASSLVETNFIERTGYAFLSEQNKAKKEQVRQEFIHNMIDSDYNICCRGSENCSFRLFETLCCGRIPIFIDTDCVLPYDFAIDWRKYCVWIDEKELPFIAEKVADFHSSLSEKDFIDLQHECRKLWQQWLSPEGFFANFYRHFELNEKSNLQLTNIHKMS